MYFEKNDSNLFKGTISILGSQHVQSCVGIESVVQAVLDAKENAKMNNITNCDFIDGKVEEVRKLVSFFWTLKGSI